MSIHKLIAAVATLMSIAFVPGCYSAPVMPPTGVIFSNIDAPISLSIGDQDLGTRRGEASCVFPVGSRAVKLGLLGING